MYDLNVVLKHLPFFVAIARTENFRRSAAHLHIAQPALSRRIHDLERELGVDLFERRSKRVRLSESGKAFFADIVEALAAVDRACDRAARVSQGDAGLLRVGFTPLTARHSALGDIVAMTRRAHPDLELLLNVMMSQDQLEALLLDKLDVGFVYHVHLENRSEFESMEILCDDVLLALPLAHPLAKQHSISLKDLRAEKFLWVRRSRGVSYYDRMIDICMKNGLTPKISQEVADSEAVLGLVSVGAGLGIVHSLASSRWSDTVAFKQVRDLSAPMRLMLVWPRSASSRWPAPSSRQIATSRPGIGASLPLIALEHQRTAETVLAAPARRSHIHARRVADRHPTATAMWNEMTQGLSPSRLNEAFLPSQSTGGADAGPFPSAVQGWRQAFRSAFRDQASSVTVVAAEHEGRRAGLTATAVCSLSDDPPSLIVGVNRKTTAYEAIRKSRRFSVNLLAEGQADIARCFSGCGGLRGEERFSVGRWTGDEGAPPILHDALASFDCVLLAEHECKTHSLFVGMVEGIAGSTDRRRPLVYLQGRYATVTFLQSDR